MPRKDPNPKYNYKELYPNTYKLAEGLTTYVPGYKKYTPENFIDMLQLISNAETGNKNIAQMGGGPGRGFYQMEKRSSKVAKNRAANINNDLINLGYKQGITIPQFNEDFTKLSKDDQAVYVLSNMVKAASSKRATDPNAYVNPLDPRGSWVQYHWAGKEKDRPAREKHWDEVNSNFNDILNNIYNQEYSIYSKEHGLKTNTQPDTPRIMDAPEFIKGAWDNTQGGWLDKFADGGVVPSVPIVEDAGEMSQDNVWVPNWKVIAEQAKKLNAKTVKTKSGVTINFDSNWNVKSVNEAPMFKDGGETPLTDPKNKPTVYRSSGRSNYDPLSNNIYFNPNNNPWNPYDILKHEGYHWAQNMYGDLQAPELYPGPLRRPQTPTNPNTSLISDYYNRAAIENDVSLNYMKQGRNAYVDEKGKSLMPDNVVVPSSPSLQFIPDDIIWKGVRTTNRPYNEYTIIPGADALRYSTPDTIEGDAMYYENNAPMSNKPIMGIYDLQDTMQHKHGGLIKRADGSYSRRGLWDNIRANRGSGRKPTAEMLRQERKIKKKDEGSWVTNSSIPTPTTPSFYDAYPDRTLTNYQMGTDKASMYGGGGGINPIYVTDPNDPRLKAYNDSLSLYNNYMNLKNTIVKGGKYYPDFESSKPLNKTKTYKFTIPNPNNPIIYKQVDPTFGYNKIGDKGLPDITIIQKKNIQPISTQTFTRKESKYKSEAEYDKAAKQIKDFNEKAGQANWIGYEIQEYKKPVQPVNLKKEEELKKVEPIKSKFDFSVDEELKPNTPIIFTPNPVRRILNPSFQESDYTDKHNSIVDPLGNPKYKYYNQDKVITQQEYNDLMQKKANGGPVMYGPGSIIEGDDGTWKPGQVSSRDSVQNMAGNTMTWEFNRGSSAGTGLSNYGNPALGYGATKGDAINWYMNNIYPQLGAFPTAMEKASAGDFMYNSGRDPRVYMLDQYLKSKGQTGLPNRAAYNVDTKTSAWTPELQKSLNEQWDTYKDEIYKLPVNTRRQLLNKGRDWYYQNINKNSDNTPSDAYWNTWYGRQHATDQYVPLRNEDVTNISNKKFYPAKKENGGPVMYNAGSTVWTKQNTPLWAAGTPTPTATQNFRNDRSLNTNRYLIGDVIPTGMNYKTPAAGTYDYSKDIQPYYTMRLHAPDTTRMGNGGPTPSAIPYRKPNTLGTPEVTKLTPAQEIAYQRYKQSLGDLGGDEDYDLRGFWKEQGVTGLSDSGKNGVHFTDKYKILNLDSPYREFNSLSDESKYASEFDRRGQGYWVPIEEVPLDTKTETIDGDWQYRAYKHGSHVTSAYKKRVGIPYAISPGVSDAGMYVGPTTQRGGMMFGDGSTVGVPPNFKPGKEYSKGWYNSPMYKSIIEKQATTLYPDNPKKVQKYVNLFLENPTNNYLPPSLIKGLTKKQEAYGINFGENLQIDKDFALNNPQLVNSLYAHELFHDNAQTNYDFDYINKLTPKFNPDIHPKGILGRASAQERYAGLTSPEEVRSEIHAIRELGKEHGVYDPFTQPFKKEYLEKINTIYNSGDFDGKNYNQIQRLKDYYSDDQIIDMMNTISQNNNQPTTNTQMAKRGGYVKNNNSNTWLDQYN